MNPTSDTAALLAEVEALLHAATEGRWTVEGLRVMRGVDVVCTLPLNYRGPAPANARLIAAAPRMLRALVARIRELEADLALTRSLLARHAAEVERVREMETAARALFAALDGGIHDAPTAPVETLRALLTPEVPRG